MILDKNDKLIGTTMTLENNKKYEIKDIINQGSYGKIFLAETSRKKKVILKIIECPEYNHPNVNNLEQKMQAHRERSGLLELSFLQNFDHDNIIKILNFGTLIKNQGKIYFIFV
jgi:serine/threonine protein kinase